MSQVIHGDCLDVLPSLQKQFHCCVTSPPYYGLRDYKVDGRDWPEVVYCPMPGLPELTVPKWSGCLGMEPTPEMFVGHIVSIFREVWRVLRCDGTLWLNFGDSYSGTGKSGGGNQGARWAEHGMDIQGTQGGKWSSPPRYLKHKDLMGIPWRVAFALQADGWYLRQDVIWHKPNPMPESVKDRCTKAHEYVFLFSKSERYYYDYQSVKERAIAASPSEFDGGAQRNADGSKVNEGHNFSEPTSYRGSSFTQGKTFENQNRTASLKPRTSRNKTHKHVKAYQSGDDSARLKGGLLKISDTFYETRNKRSVWSVATRPCSEAHFAVYPAELIEPCILAGAPIDGKVLDPFGGAGTTGMACKRHRRNYTLIELSKKHCQIAQKRISQEPCPQLELDFAEGI
ncbi:MAG: site-specific DNA-methyltransferase [Cyanobacteria bacterium P01_F01_bin.3]